MKIDKYAQFSFLLVDRSLRMWSSLAAMVNMTCVCRLISIQHNMSQWLQSPLLTLFYHSPVLLPLAAGGAFLKLHIWAGQQQLSDEEQSCCQSCLTCNSSGRFTFISPPSDRTNSKFLRVSAKFLCLPGCLWTCSFNLSRAGYQHQ